MQHVKSGEKIKASLMNEIIDTIQPQKDFSYETANSRLPKSFIIQANSGYNSQTSASTLSSIVVYNNFIQSDGELYEADDKEWTSNLDSLSTLFAGIVDGDLSVFSNLDDSDDISAKWRLYDISASTSSDSFLIKRDYRGTASTGGGGGGTPYGAFQFEIREEGGLKMLEFKYCVFQFGRKTYKIGTDATYTVVPFTAGTYYLNIPHSSPANAMVIPIDTGNSLTTTSIPLVQLGESGNIICDYRAMPVVPVWEATPSGA